MKLEKALEAIREYNMLSEGDTVIVGLSGGADSVCLLSLLFSLREEYALRLIAAHINHGIRGSEADRDEQFCKELCEKLEVPFEALHADIPVLAKENGEGLEECGRRVRYEFFASLAGDKGKIATAHNMNDVAETLIFNLTRGTALKGAGSIAPVRYNIIRPLITTRRDEIEEYLKDNSLDFVTDSTNLSNDYSRNRIRNEVLPVLKSINPNALSALAAFSSHAREDERLLEKLTVEAYDRTVTGDELDAESYSQLDSVLKKRVARRYISQFTDADILSKHIEDFIRLSDSGGELQSAGALRFVLRQGRIKPYEDNAEPFEIEIKSFDCVAEYPYGKISIKTINQKDLQFLNKELLEMCVDCDKICGNLTLRSRRQGDSITIHRRSVTKTLKKLFNEDAVPPEKRNTVPVIADDNGVVWVKGYGTSEKYRVDKNTESALIITMM